MLLLLLQIRRRSSLGVGHRRITPTTVGAIGNSRRVYRQRSSSRRRRGGCRSRQGSERVGFLGSRADEARKLALQLLHAAKTIPQRRRAFPRRCLALRLQQQQQQHKENNYDNNKKETMSKMGEMITRGIILQYISIKYCIRLPLMVAVSAGSLTRFVPGMVGTSIQ